MSDTPEEGNGREFELLLSRADGFTLTITVTDRLLAPENRELLGAFFATAVRIVTETGTPEQGFIT